MVKRMLSSRWRWRAATFIRMDVMLVASFLASTATIRGADYISAYFSHRPSTASLRLIEAAFPLWVWGAWFLTGAVVLIAGMYFRIHPVVFIGHCILFVAYATLGVALFLTLPSFIPPTGIRTSFGMLIPAALHFLYAFRMGPRPLTHEGQHVREVVVGE